MTHLQYADDTLFFVIQMKNKKILRVIFVLFEGMSGLHINWGKSFLYPINEVITMQSVNAIPGGEIGSLPTMHLGMPLGANSKSNEIWNNVVEKCEKKLARWKRRYLSLGGRLTLVNSRLDSFPTYIMSLFPISAIIISRLVIIWKKFLWQGNKDRKSYHSVQCESLIIYKSFGGLGIRNLDTHSKDSE